MDFYSTLIAGALAVSLIIILTASIKSKCFFKSFFLTAFSGLGCLFALSFASGLIGLTVPVNLFTAAVSALSGIPGVIMLLLTVIAL